MTKQCKECGSEDNVKKITVPIKTRKGEMLKTKNIWVCETCLDTIYPDYRTQHPKLKVRGREINTGGQ